MNLALFFWQLKTSLTSTPLNSAFLNPFIPPGLVQVVHLKNPITHPYVLLLIGFKEIWAFSYSDYMELYHRLGMQTNFNTFFRHKQNRILTLTFIADPLPQNGIYFNLAIQYEPAQWSGFQLIIYKDVAAKGVEKKIRKNTYWFIYCIGSSLHIWCSGYTIQFYRIQGIAA